MKTRAIFVTFTLLLVITYHAAGMFLQAETEKVPIDRVLKNLERRLATNQNNVETLYYLARTHSMAYSTNLKIVEMVTNFSKEPFPEFIRFDFGAPYSVIPRYDPGAQTEARQHLTNAISLYERAVKLGATDANGSTRWIISPVHIGYAWCLDQAGRRADAIQAYRRALQISWDLEVHDQPTLREQATWSWDQIRAKKNPLTRPPLRSLGVGICYSQEIINYLLKLLDPVKDAKEIAQLKKDEKVLKSMSRAITPILLPLAADTPFTELANPSARVKFDLDGSGLSREWGWITPKAAWLVYDHDGRGQITSGLQMFGNVTFWIFWRDGYDALRSLDDNGDGVLSGNELRGIALWEDRNGDGICDLGEVRPVTNFGIIEIKCDSQLHETGIPFNPQGITLRDGSTRATYDWIVPIKIKARFIVL